MPVWFKVFLAWCCIASGLYALPVKAQPDCQCQPEGSGVIKHGGLKINVIARLDAASERQWFAQIAPELPTVDADQSVSQPVQNQLSQMQSQAAEWRVTDSDEQEGLLTFLAATLATRNVNICIEPTARLQIPPTEAELGQLFSETLCLRYRVPGQATTAVKVEIVLQTTRGAGEQASTEILTLGELVQELSNDPAKLLPVSLSWTQADLEAARKAVGLPEPELLKQHLRRELSKVAHKAFTVARQQEFLDPNGNSMMSPENFDQGKISLIQNAIAQDLNLSNETQIEWADVKARIRHSESSWRIIVSNLNLAQRVEVRIVKDPREPEEETSRAARRLKAKRRLAQMKLNRVLRKSGQAKLGHLLTMNELEQDAQLLLQQRDMVESLRFITSTDPNRTASNTDENNVYYEVLRKLKIRPINLRAGGSYSPTEKFTGNIGAETLNLLGLQEQILLDYAQGAEVLKLRFQASRPFVREPDHIGWWLRDANINVQYFRDKDQRLGNLTALEIEARELGSTASLSFGYDSNSVLDREQFDCLTAANRKLTRFAIFNDISLNYRDVNIPASSALLNITGLKRSLLPSPQTQIASLNWQAQAAATRDFRRSGRAGMGILEGALELRLQKGMNLLGSDYSFGKAYLAARVEATFGLSTAQDFLVRYERNLGRASDGVPVFELFRMGGANNVRGIEEGEFIGRKITSEQYELGLSALSLMSWLRGQKPQQPQLCNDDQPAPPFDFRRIYIKGFIDRSRLSDPTSFEGAVNSTAGFQQRSHGYGIAIELRQLAAGEAGQGLNLTLGYAFSPQSKLHRSGTLVTGVSFIF